MSKVDWSLAPEGATHYCDGAMSGFWRDLSERTWKFYRDSDGTWHDSGDKVSSLLHNSIGLKLIERPKPEHWSGPQDGLPPVGEIVEYSGFSLDLKPGSRVEIIHHFSAGVADAAAFLYYKSGGRYVSQAIAAYFKPVRTTSDISAEKRETAIRELMDIAQVDCRVTAARLVDAGFKRGVV